MSFPHLLALWFGCPNLGADLPCNTCSGGPDEMAEPPRELAPFQLLEVDPERSEMANGFLLLSQLDDEDLSFVSVINGCADPIWWRQSDGPDVQIMRARLGRDGRSVVYGIRDQDTRVDIGALVRVDLITGEETRTRALDHHHDFVELPEGGRFTYMSRDRVPDIWFSGKYPLVADVVRIAEEGDANPTDHPEVFNGLEDIDLRPWTTCHHMGPQQFLKEHLDWTHVNSLVYDDETGDYTMGVRHFDAVVRFDGNGAIRWWLGGRLNTLDPLDGAAPPRHGHFSEAWSDGMLVFDNGNHVPDAVTRIVEYAIDAEAQTYREVWSYDHPEGGFFAARGDARRLPGGNVLVAWTGNGQIWEITREGDVVWRADTEQKVVRMQFLPDWSAGPTGSCR